MHNRNSKPTWSRLLCALALVGATSLVGCAAYGGDDVAAYTTGWAGPGAYDAYPDGAYFTWAGGAIGPDREYGDHDHGDRHAGSWHDAGLHHGGWHDAGPGTAPHAGWHGSGPHIGTVAHVGAGFGGHLGGFAGHGGGGRA